MYAGIVYDTLRKLGTKKNFVIDPKIYPLDDKSKIYGKVFTTYGKVVGAEGYMEYDIRRFDIPKAITDEKIVVLSTKDRVVAHAGDITLYIYRKAGIKGFITDGLVRDAYLIKHEMGFPCFCNGTTSVDAIDYWALTAFQEPVQFYGIAEEKVIVEPGDYIYADSDGALLIPQESVIDFEVLVKKELIRENKIRRDLYKLTLEEIFKRHGRW